MYTYITIHSTCNEYVVHVCVCNYVKSIYKLLPAFV